MVNYAKHLRATTKVAKPKSNSNVKSSPQTLPIRGREAEMVRNDGGGVSFAVDPFVRLNRFLISGCEGGHFTVGEAKLTVENAQCVLQCAALDPVLTVNTIVEISESGRAPKNDAALFALALIVGHVDPTTNVENFEKARLAALANLDRVCRIFTHLTYFLEIVTQFRGWGRALRNAVSKWYTGKTIADLAFQMTKYRNRNGYTHRDLLRLSHPSVGNGERSRLFAWAVGKKSIDLLEPGHNLAACGVLDYLNSLDVTHKKSEKIVAKAIKDYRLVWEHIPTDFLNSTLVWEALLQHMPVTATIRNLGKLTALGLLAPLSDASRIVCERLKSEEALKKGRVHPFSILLAADTYRKGHGDKGKLSWNPVRQVTDALEVAFEASFASVEPTGKRFYLGVDCSGSMGWDSSRINNTNITAREGAACMSLVTLRREEQSIALAFSNGMHDIGLSPNLNLKQTIEACEKAPASYTDCSAPMRDARERKIPVDAFIVYTDNDTNNGQTEHPIQALDRYRQATGIGAKLIVVSMVSNGHSIADPNDAGTLDITGFDSEAPAIIADFVGYSKPLRQPGRKAA